MKKLGILALILGVAISFGCEKAKEKAKDATDKGKAAAKDVKENVEKGKMDDAVKSGKKGVDDVKKAITGEGSGKKEEEKKGSDKK